MTLREEFKFSLTPLQCPSEFDDVQLQFDTID